MITFLGTEDLEKTRKFYTEYLGFNLYKNQEKCQIYEAPGGGMIGFCSHINVITSKNPGETSKESIFPYLSLFPPRPQRLYYRNPEIF